MTGFEWKLDPEPNNSQSDENVRNARLLSQMAEKKVGESKSRKQSTREFCYRMGPWEQGNRRPMD
jgi:hypothetical protein